MKEIISKKILKGAGVLLVLVALILSTSAVIADTTKDQTKVSPANLSTEGIHPIVDHIKKVDIEKSGLVNMTGRAVILSEDFEGTWIPDPDGDGPPYMVPVDPTFGPWDIEGLCMASQYDYPQLTHYWSDFTPSDHPLYWPFPHSGEWCAGLWWSDGFGGDPYQDEWLITPEISGYIDLQLTFYSAYTMMRYGHNPGQHNYVQISTDGGFNWTILGDLRNDPEFDFDGCSGGPTGDTSWNWNEKQIVIDLPSAASLMIAWTYVWDYTGSAGIWMVDDVEITGEGVQLEIGDINGGFGVSSSIKNAGITEALDVEWSIAFDGGTILFPPGSIVTGGPINIFPNTDETISTKAIGLGGLFRPLNITVSADANNADPVSKTVAAKIFLFFVII